MFATFERHTKEFIKAWEQAAGQWWDTTLRSPETLGRMGSVLGAASSAKERTDRALEDHWNRWRLPSASDVERLHERIGDLELQLERLEELLRRAGASPASASHEPHPAPAPAKPEEREDA